jgi:integrase
VDLSPQLLTVLQRQKEIRQLQAMDTAVEMLPFVFLSPEGGQLEERNIRRAWYRCLDRAGVREVRFHDLRHTFASQLIDQGAHPKYIQEQMGHSGIQVTMDIYGHLLPNGNRGWVAKLDDMAKMPRTAAETATQAQPEGAAVA